MWDDPNRVLLEKTFTRVWWIALALMGSLFVEAIVIELVAGVVPLPGFTDPENELSPNIRYILLVLAVSDALFLPFLRRRLLTVQNKASPKILIARLQATSIVTLAISSFPAWMGMVIFLLWMYRGPFYFLWVFSLVLLLAYFPRKHFWL